MTAIRFPLFPPFRVGSEGVAITIAILFFLCFPGLIRLVDPSAAAVDAGALSMIAMAVLGLLCFKALTWWLIKAIWPVLAAYAESQFGKDFMLLPRKCRVVIFLGFYLALLFGFILTLTGLA